MTPDACERLASLGLNSISGPKTALKLTCGGTGQGLGHRESPATRSPKAARGPREPHAFLPDSSSIQGPAHGLLKDACRLEIHARGERQGGTGGIASVVITARRGVGVPARLPLGFSEKGLFGYTKGWLHLPLQLGRDISGLLSAEASPTGNLRNTLERTHTGRSLRRPRAGTSCGTGTGPAARVPGWELREVSPPVEGAWLYPSVFFVLAPVWQAGRQQRQSPVPPALGTDQDWPGDPCCASHQEPSVVLP